MTPTTAGHGLAQWLYRPKPYDCASRGGARVPCPTPRMIVCRYDTRSTGCRRALPSSAAGTPLWVTAQSWQAGSGLLLGGPEPAHTGRERPTVRGFRSRCPAVGSRATPGCRSRARLPRHATVRSVNSKRSHWSGWQCPRTRRLSRPVSRGHLLFGFPPGRGTAARSSPPVPPGFTHVRRHRAISPHTRSGRDPYLPGRFHGAAGVGAGSRTMARPQAENPGPHPDRIQRLRRPRMPAPCRHPAEDPHYPAKRVRVSAAAVPSPGPRTGSRRPPACASQIREEPQPRNAPANPQVTGEPAPQSLLSAAAANAR